MRIVAGQARGRKLTSPPGDDTRPTSDRVREALFNSLYSLDDAVRGAVVVDLFAGTGALGLEALSRGAQHVTFVESSYKAIAALETNIDGTGVDRSQVSVVRQDVMAWLQRHAGPSGHSFDVALVDPPYDFDSWPALLGALPARIAVIESNREVTNDHDGAQLWDPIRVRRYGGTVVSIIRRPTGLSPMEPSS